MANETGKIRVTVPREERVWELTPLETSPCTLACPTRINARGYVSLVSDGKFVEALALIRERNPFPGVCGRVCPRPCEAACARGKYDEPIAICALKRFVFDLEMKRGINPAAPARITRTDKVAIIGAGPAGLSAARELALLGYPATIFEANDAAGGMMNLIPEFRLPQRVVKREARAILDRGIELVTGATFGKVITWNKLKRRGYKALLLATGAWRPAWKWGASGVRGVYHAIDFLRHAALEIEEQKVMVAGDGMMALDCARTAARLGAKSVTLIVGKSRELAPVHRDDLAQAEKEGVKTLFLARPSRLVTKGKKLAGIKCMKLKEGPPDATGRREVFEISGSEFTGDADIFVDAYARGIDARGFPEKGAKGVFTAGDLATGPRSVVEAIQSGQKAAYGIHHYLSGETLQSPFDLTIDEDIARREFTLEIEPGEKAPRVSMPLEEARTRKADFREVEKGYSAQAARSEAQRCLRCGPCDECEVCVDICEKKDILLRVNDDFVVNVHAGREFWSSTPDRVIHDAGDEHVEAKALRTICAVDEDLCIGCGRCENVCGYKAVQVDALPGGRFIARIEELACKGCGNCVAVCPTGAADQLNFERASVLEKLSKINASQSKVLFLCHWAGPNHLDLPNNVIVIATMCAGRISPDLIVEAVLRGASRVMICGCAEENCHYAFGRKNGKRSVEQAKALLKLFGCKPEVVTEFSTDPKSFAMDINKWAWKSK